jgi:uncharacterized protein (TIGR03382 family)
MPAALKILELGTQGQGRVVVDNSSDVSDMMDDDDMMSSGGSGGSGGSAPGGAGTNGSAGSSAGSAGGSGGDGDDDDGESPSPDGVAASDGGCSTTGARPVHALAPVLLALGMLARRRRRHAA